jgi:1,5-anhydro-D-fructose reductase (1,5-anhydro-D-mannitol-forming)
MLNVAMLSKWHVHAEGYANDLINTGKVKITAVWDDDVERGSEWAGRLGADFEPDLKSCLPAPTLTP